MSDAQRRAVRTLAQAVPAAVVVSGWNLFAPSNLDMTAEQATWVTLVLTGLVSFVQNWFEDHTSLPTLLGTKPDGPPPPATTPSASTSVM